MDVLCIGNAGIDVFIILQNLHKFNFDKFSNQISFPLGEKIPLDEYKLTLGGNACNVSVGLSRLGLKTSLAAQIGSDEFSEKILNSLKKEDVNTQDIDKSERETPYFNIVLAYEGERTILEEKRPDSGELKITTSNPKMIYLSSVAGDWQKVYKEIFAAYPNSLFAYNPGARQIKENTEKIREILPKLEILFVNLSEAQILTGDTGVDIEIILGKLKKLGPKNAIVTDGANGSFTIDVNGKMFKIGVISSGKPKERTGAGDSYAAGFIYGYLSQREMQDCMRLGSINSDSVIRRVGAQDGLLTKEEIETRSSELKNFTAESIE